MGEKGNVEMLDELKGMAQQQEPGLRDRMMELLSDFQTVQGLGITGGGRGKDGGTGDPSPPGPQGPQT
jgi:hypothetical protein